jgi:hypothetical protein
LAGGDRLQRGGVGPDPFDRASVGGEKGGQLGAAFLIIRQESFSPLAGF